MSTIIFILRYIWVVSLSILPLALYMEYVMKVGDYPFPVMFGFGIMLMIFAEIVQFRIKK